MVVKATATADRSRGDVTAGHDRRRAAPPLGRPRTRCQSPVYSPLSAAAVAGSAAAAADPSDDPRSRLGARLRARFSADEAVLCGSGTEALQLALRLALEAIGDGAPGCVPVALPAFTCFDVAAAAVRVEAPIVLYDVDPSTLSPDPASLERVLDAGARVVVLAPLYGVPLEWDAIEGRLRRHGAVGVEDAAQGHGATWRGQPLGGVGRISVLSFGRGKGWTGSGGGALLLRGIDRAPLEWVVAGRRSRFRDDLASATAAAAQWAFARPGFYAIPASIPWLGLGETRYRPAGEVRGIGRFAAALAARTEHAAAVEAAHRRTAAGRLRAAIRPGGTVQHVRVPEGGVAGFLRLPLRCAGGIDGLRDPAAARRLGVAPSYPSTLAALPPVRSRLHPVERRWPGAEELVRRLVTLPTHSRLGPAERRAIVRLLDDRSPGGGR